MTHQPNAQIDAAAAVAHHAALMGHVDTALPDSTAENWIGYESCHPLTWLPSLEPETHFPR